MVKRWEKSPECGFECTPALIDPLRNILQDLIPQLSSMTQWPKWASFFSVFVEKRIEIARQYLKLCNIMFDGSVQDQQKNIADKNGFKQNQIWNQTFLMNKVNITKVPSVCCSSNYYYILNPYCHFYCQLYNISWEVWRQFYIYHVDEKEQPNKKHFLYL